MIDRPLTRAAVLCVMLGAATIFLANARRAESTAARTDFAAFPMALDGWQAVNDPPMTPEVLAVLGADDYLSRVYYRPDGTAVGLYLGYHRSQRRGDTIHSPLNCLPGAGWAPVSEGRLPIANIDGAGRDVVVNRYVIQKGLDRQLVLYWYQAHGRVVASEYWSRAYLIHDAIRLNRTDGALVRVIAPIRGEGGDEDAERLAESFVRTIFPSLPEYLPE